MAELPKIRHGLFGQYLDKKLPRMVDWFDPLILAMVGVRTVISTTIGQYADQRPAQAAMDREDSADVLAMRHDYSQIDPALKIAFSAAYPERQLKLDDDGGLWVDFIADLGDGFEATYAMAYLMAMPSIELPVAGSSHTSLKAGEIMIMGGDHAYPNATIDEYQNRCLDPYNAAYQLPTGPDGQLGNAPRKLFFIAGNHDWYDGLSAFTSVFCAARTKETDGLKIGGWQSEQRRSYFALKLPHGWWMWGVDTGLSDGIDIAQWRYFEAVAAQLEKNDKIIIITHAPGWLNKQDVSQSDIVELVRDTVKNTKLIGVEIRAVIAGDSHHYSRYASQIAGEEPVHLITSGGGGAFLHPTHQLKRRIKARWPDGASEKIPDAAPFGLLSQLPRAAESRKERAKRKGTKKFHGSSFYPSRIRSRMIALKHIFLPFHNRRFAIALGFIYFLFAWVYQASNPHNIEYQIPPTLAEITKSEALAVGAGAAAAVSQVEPVVRRFLDLAGQQTVAPQLKSAADSARAAIDLAAETQGLVRAASAKLVEAEIARKEAALDLAQWIEGLENAKAGIDAAMAAGNKPDATPEAVANANENKKELQDYLSQIEAARTKLNDEDKRLKTVLQSAQVNRGQAYQLVDAAIQSSYLAFQHYDLASEALRNLPGVSPQLSEAAAQARTAIHQARSAVDLARMVEARGAGLNEDATKFKEVHKPRGDMWGEIIDRANFNPAFAFMLLGLLVGLIYFVDAELTSAWLSWLNWPIKIAFGWLHFSLHISALLFVDKTTKTLIYVSDAIAALFFAISSIVWAVIASAGWAALGQVTGGGMRVTNPEMQRRLAEEATEKFATNVVNKLQWMKVCADKFEFKADGIRLAGRCFKDHYQGLFDISSMISYIGTSVLLGSLLGGLIFGLYSMLTSALFSMHFDTFGALGIKGYKNFLRMKVFSDRIVVYAIGLDKVPGRRGWREPTKSDVLAEHNPQILPKHPLQPHLIEVFEISRGAST